jgi:DedD protein
MAFFKPRKGDDESAASTASGGRQPAESIEAMRRRAKHRLIGACVLVLVAVIGFPLLFDTQPRPISVDIPIEIPDRAKVKPLPAPAAAPTPAAATSVTQAPPPEAKVASVPAAAPAASVAKAEAAVKQEAAVTEAKVTPKPEPKPQPQPQPQPARAPDDGAKAQALLEGKPVASTPVPAEGRYVVQVGAFSDVAKARETRLKVEHAGLKTYTQVVETKDGKRIRVRVGPFANKAEAEKAAEKVKGLDLQASVLTL